MLLARQRSGTHPIRSILDSHPDVCCLDEIFFLKDAHSDGTGETNFFTFIKKHTATDPLKLIPVDYEELFLDYLGYLRTLLSKPYILMDVKYNSTHHITRGFQSLSGPPYLVELILKHGLRTFVLTRKHYLRYCVSLAKTHLSKKYVLRTAEPNPEDKPVRLGIHELLLELNRCRREDEMVTSWFTTGARALGCDYSGKFFTYDYADAFPARTRVISPKFLERFSKWLAIPCNFAQECEFKKQSHLPLGKTIENFEEVAAALRGTKFEQLLEDEPAYGRIEG